MRYNPRAVRQGGCYWAPPCPVPVPDDPECTVTGEYYFCGGVNLHLNTPPGEYEVLKLVDGKWCSVGGVPITEPCSQPAPPPDAPPVPDCKDDILDFSCDGQFVIRWCVAPGCDEPVFSTSPASGHMPYFACAKPVGGDVQFECYTSFTVCVPACCDAVMTVDGYGFIELEPANEPYCMGFGPFDMALGNMTFAAAEGSEDCLSDIKVCVQRSTTAGPPVMSAAPKPPRSPCGMNEKSAIAPFCFRRTSDSPVENGFMVAVVTSTGIETTVFDADNNQIMNYTKVPCC